MKTITTDKKAAETDTGKANDLRKMIRQFDIPLIYYVLKTCTDRDHAMSCSEIVEKLSRLLPHPDEYDSFFDTRTMTNKMNEICMLSDTDETLIQRINTYFSGTFGGMIRSREADGIYNGKTRNAKGSQRRYYFEPLLSASDMELIFGAINSSRFLSEKEKHFLVRRLDAMQPSFDSDENKWIARKLPGVNDLPERPRTSVSVFPGHSSVILHNTQVIYDAIERKKQIEVIYGSYESSSCDEGIIFEPKNGDRPYILNPYALMWNAGEYYLIATHKDHNNPVHFRVDRMINVRLHSIIDSNGIIKKEASRKPIPETLKKFYRNERGRLIFDPLAYSGTFPEMIYHQEENLIDITFECSLKNLQVLIDSFGTNISLSGIPGKKGRKTDKSADSCHIIRATVHDVQYENAKFYALSHAHFLKLIAPKKLMKEIAGTVK
ncbi:MAG: WYL domain-containing protein [Lachnospiraceae bacterium]|nr:WYL domain-containing protein [Lachnospiraceae bacterium]